MPNLSVLLTLTLMAPAEGLMLAARAGPSAIRTPVRMSEMSRSAIDRY